jgi:NTE family protein
MILAPFRTASLLLLLFLLLIAGSAPGQPQRVGLVLSGGGGLGMAHIGVIKALEEHNIPVDYITGTSAGALIGGFYAAGYTPTEIEQIALDQGQQWLAPGLSLQEDYYLRRTEPDASFLTVPINLNAKRGPLPDNLISDAELNIGLANLLSGATGAAKNDFDSLFVPFRAVAANISDKQTIVLEEGSLPFAVRASIAVPLFFHPASNFQYKNLYDGGIYNNFPVGPMRENFGPDVIIGVDVTGQRKVSKEMESDQPGLLRLLMLHVVEQPYEAKLPDSSIYINPDLEDMSSMDFDPEQVDFAIQRGYNAALEAMDSIKKLIRARRSARELALRRRRFRNRQPPYKITSIEIKGCKKTEKLFIRRLLRIDPGDTLSRAALRAIYLRLRREGNYAKLFPELVWAPAEGGYRLQLLVQGESNLHLKVGASLFTPTDHQLEFGAVYSGKNIVSYRAGVNLMRGSFTNHAKVSGRLYYPSQLPIMLQLENNLVQWELQNKLLTLFGSENRANVNFNSWEFAASLGMPILENGKLNLGHAWQSHTDSYFRNPTLASRDQFDRLNFSGRSTFLTLQKSSIPQKMYGTEGRAIYLSARYNSGTIDYNAGGGSERNEKYRERWFQTRFQYKRLWQPRKYFSWGLSIDAAYSDLDAYPTPTATYLSSPKFAPLQDSRILYESDLYSKLYAAPGARLYFHFLEDFKAHLAGYWMHSFEDVRQTGTGDYRHNFNFRFNNKTVVASAGLSYDTTIGPIGAFLNYYEDPGGPFRAFLHVGYLIFNKHPWY